MWRNIIVAVFFGILSLGVQAQYAFDEGDIAINAGAGFFSKDGSLPSFYLSVELGLIPTSDIGVISIGGVAEHKFSKINGQFYNQATIAPRAIWHFHFPFLNQTNLDLYTGLGAGLHHYRKYNLTTFVYDRKIIPFMETFIGGRLLIENHLGIFAEISSGEMASVRAGIVYRL